MLILSMYNMHWKTIVFPPIYISTHDMERVSFLLAWDIHSWVPSSVLYDSRLSCSTNGEGETRSAIDDIGV